MDPLGVVVIDEEHDASYKQDNVPHYHARDTAEEKARLNGAVLIWEAPLPLWKPTAEQRQGKSIESSFPAAWKIDPSPTVRLVDMRKERIAHISDALVAAIRERLAKGEQSMVFLNRRGYSTHVECKGCGWVARCPLCQVSLIVHRTGTQGRVSITTPRSTRNRSQKCPSCGGEVLKISGRGTQRVVADMATLFPSARCLRWEPNIHNRKTRARKDVQDVMEGRAEHHCATQMIAQGHKLPNLTLVGVLDTSRSLSFPDFRAAERTFQLLMQVTATRTGPSPWRSHHPNPRSRPLRPLRRGQTMRPSPSTNWPIVKKRPIRPLHA